MLMELYPAMIGSLVMERVPLKQSRRTIDDHGSSYLAATTLTGSATNNIVELDEHLGIIERQADSDYFEMMVGNGELNIDVEPASI